MRENLSSGFPTRSDTYMALLLQNMARGLKFRIKEIGLHHLGGADQLRSDCAFVYTYAKKTGFLMTLLIPF